MKRKIIFLAIWIIVLLALLAGLLLAWASFQSFESLSSLLNNLAADGRLESFTLSLYQTLKTPFALAGVILALLCGFILFRWAPVERWLDGFPARVGDFFSLLRKDTRGFLEDARRAIINVGWGGIALLSGLTLVALAMRLANLDLPLGHDEAYTYNAFASRSIWHLVSDYHLPNNHVFLSLVIHVTTRVLGDPVWAIRLPTILAGVLMVPATFWFAKRFHSLETAFLSASLVAIFPVLIKYSVYARGYTFICLFTLLILSLGDYVRVKNNRFAWIGIVVLSALGFFTIPIMLFPFGGLYVWLLGSWFIGDIRSYEGKWDFLKHWLVSGFSAAFITLLLYLPIIINNANRFFGNGFIAPLEWDVFLETLWTRLRNTGLEWTESVPLWTVALGVLGILSYLIFYRKFSRPKFPLQVAFFLWMLILMVVRRPDMLPRFWLFLAAPLLTWAAAGIVEPLKLIPLKVGMRGSLARAFLGLLLALVLVYGLTVIPTIPARAGSNDGMAKVALFLKDNIQEGDLVTATSARLPALRYYFSYFGVPRGYIRQSGQFQRAFIIVDGNKVDTLETIAPQLGFDIPAIDMATLEIVYQQAEFTVYKCAPLP